MADKRPLILASGGSVQELGADDLLVAHAGTTTARIDSSDGTAALFLDKGASGATAAINAYKNNSIRWQVNLGDATAESGSNAGSNFSIARFNDAGTLLATSFSIDRATGAASFGSGLTTSGGITSGLSVTASSGNITAAAGDVVASGAVHAASSVTNISSTGLTNTGENYSGSTAFRNIISTAPAGYYNILSSQHTPGVSACWQFQVGAGAANYTFLNNGHGQATQWDSISDERLKENFELLTGVLRRMKQSPVWSFTWKGGHIGMGGPQIPKRQLGGKAQEFEQTFPEIVSISPTEELPDKRVMNVGGMGVIAYAGVLELLERVERLEARIAELEGARA